MRVHGTILHSDDSLWSESTIYTLCVPLGPDLDATVKSTDFEFLSLNRLERQILLYWGSKENLAHEKF